MQNKSHYSSILSLFNPTIHQICDILLLAINRIFKKKDKSTCRLYLSGGGYAGKFES